MMPWTKPLWRLLAEKEQEVAIIKKGVSVLRKKPDVKYAFMNEHSVAFSVLLMARVLKVSRNGFYAWLRSREPGPRRLARAARKFMATPRTMGALVTDVSDNYSIATVDHAMAVRTG